METGGKRVCNQICRSGKRCERLVFQSHLLASYPLPLTGQIVFLISLHSCLLLSPPPLSGDQSTRAVGIQRKGEWNGQKGWQIGRRELDILITMTWWEQDVITCLTCHSICCKSFIILITLLKTNELMYLCTVSFLCLLCNTLPTLLMYEYWC